MRHLRAIKVRGGREETRDGGREGGQRRGGQDKTQIKLLMK